MRTALAISTAAHALVLGAVLFSFAAPTPLDAPLPEVVPVTIVPDADVSRAVEGDTTAPPVAEKPPAPKPTRRPAREEPAVNAGDTATDVPTPEAPRRKAPPVEAVAPPPTARPEPPAAKAEAAPEPAPQPEAEPAPATPAPPKQVSLLDRRVVPTIRPRFEAPKPKTEPAKARPKKTEPKSAKAKPKPTKTEPAEAKPAIDQIKALLDRQQAAAGGAKRSTRESAAGARTGSAARLTRSELDALRQQVQACFGVPAVGGADPASLRVTLEFELHSDGTLDGRPRVTRSSGPDPRAERSFAGAARRAVTKCGRRGFDLPAAKFETWREVEVNFSLADML